MYNPKVDRLFPKVWRKHKVDTPAEYTELTYSELAFMLSFQFGSYETMINASVKISHAQQFDEPGIDVPFKQRIIFLASLCDKVVNGLFLHKSRPVYG